eukprot:359024-Chlamydomonas_euryale.AAC.2
MAGSQGQPGDAALNTVGGADDGCGGGMPEPPSLLLDIEGLSDALVLMDSVLSQVNYLPKEGKGQLGGVTWGVVLGRGRTSVEKEY